MLPYADDTPSLSVPIWVIILIVLNLLFFAGSYLSGHDHYVRTIFAYGAIPARFFQPADQPVEFDPEIVEYIRNAGIDQLDWPSPFVTLFTSMFLHGGWFHLIGNMWFLWLFGDNVEDRMGKLIFPVFYIFCGLCAGLLHVAFAHGSAVPAIGASGAIAGVMGAYIYLFPNGKISTLVGFYFYFTTIYIPAQIFLGFWFIMQLFGGFVQDGGNNVAFWAHVGGFAAGLLLAIFLKSAGLITLYPGDRGYKRREILPPLASARTTIETNRPRKYIWRE
jgi:membrane associated rhomboid family serine protease